MAEITMRRLQGRALGSPACVLQFAETELRRTARTSPVPGESAARAGQRRTGHEAGSAGAASDFRLKRNASLRAGRSVPTRPGAVPLAGAAAGEEGRMPRPRRR